MSQRPFSMDPSMSGQGQPGPPPGHPGYSGAPPAVHPHNQMYGSGPAVGTSSAAVPSVPFAHSMAGTAAPSAFMRHTGQAPGGQVSPQPPNPAGNQTPSFSGPPSVQPTSSQSSYLPPMNTTSPGNPPPMAGPPSHSQPPMGGPPSHSQPPMGGPPSHSQPPMGGPPPHSQPPMGGPPSHSQPPMGGPPSHSQPPMGGPPSHSQPPMGGPPSSHSMPPMGGPSSHNQAPMGGPPSHNQPPTGGPPSNNLPPMGGPPSGNPPPTGGATSHSQPSSTSMPPRGATAGSGPSGRYPQPGAAQPLPPAGGTTLLERAIYPPGASPSGPSQFLPPAGQPTAAGQPSQPSQYASPGQYTQPPRQPPVGALPQDMGRMSLTERSQTVRVVNLLGNRTVLPAQAPPPPKPDGAKFRGVVLPDPDYIRATMTVVPESREQLDACRLPLGIILQPFRQMPSADLPLIRHLVMVRCRTCRAYFHPFVTFLNSHQWQCSLCYRTNEVPDSFYNAEPDQENHRTRPELRCCAVEYLAPREYWTGPPSPACYVFMIEVTAASQRIGLLENVCKLLAKNFASLPGDKRRQIVIITYGRGIGFYAFKADAVQPQMYLVNDLEEQTLPVPSTELKVNIDDYLEMLQDFFEQLPAIHTNSNDSENCLGSAMQAALQLVNKSGRITLFQASLPNMGQGVLKPTDPALKEPKLDASSGFYKELSLEANQQQIAVDIFAFGVKPLDLATTSGLCQYSSGQVYFYSDSLPSSVPHGERFHRDFSHYLTREVGFEAIMRLRCSYGVTMESFFGNFFHPRSDNLNMPNLNPELTLGVQLAIEDKLPQKSGFITLQSAVLYTTCKGERRTRVTTIAIPTSSSIPDVFEGADVEGIALLVAKMASANAPNALVDAREGVTLCAVDCLKSYLRKVIGQSAQGLLAPTSIASLPLLFNGLLASLPFSQLKSITNDDRVYGLRLLDQLPISQAIRFIYPRLYAVHDLGEEHATPRETGGPRYCPAQLQPSLANLTPAGIFLLDTGLTLFMWIGQSTSPEVIKDLFDVESVAQLPETHGHLPVLENPRSRAVSTFILQIRKLNALFAPLFIVRADSQASKRMLHRLVDDSDNGLQEHSYYSLLTRLDKAVKAS